MKLFDFGLATVVKTPNVLLDETYEMTGNTGTLRYMAPEVCLQKPYSEKVDVYSFGITLWQMARNSIPFDGLYKEHFFRIVVVEGERPKIDTSWPEQFSRLLRQCWDADYRKRPSFSQVVLELESLIENNTSLSSPQSKTNRASFTRSRDRASIPRRGSIVAGRSNSISNLGKSSWF